MENFVSSFKLFENLNVKTLRLIKHHMNLDSQKVLLRKGTVFKDIYFVQEGNINIYNTSMKLLNYFEKGELYGLNEFYC